MIYAPNRGFVFIHIGRTGGTSIELSLCRELSIDFEETKKDPDGKWWKHIWAKHMMKRMGVDAWNASFTFAFTRNPYDMILSLYSMYTQYPQYTDPDAHPKLYHPWNQFENFEHFVLSMGARRHEPDENWTTPLRKLNARTTMDVWDSLQNLQTSYLTDSWKGLGTPGRVLVEFVGRYENLEDDFRTACRRIGLEGVELIDHGGTEHADYRDIYTAEMREIVDAHFWLDIRRFGYEF